METNNRNNHESAESDRSSGGRHISSLSQTLISLGVILGVILLAALSARQCSTPSPFAEKTIGHSSGDTIDIAIEYGPATMTQLAGDSLGGIAYEMLRAIAGDSMVMKFHPVSTAPAALDMLNSHKADIAVAEMATVAEFDPSLRFSEPVRLDNQVLVQRVDSATASPITSVLELAGRTVTVPARSHILARLRNIEAEIGDSINIVADSLHGSEQLFLLVAVGEIPYAVVNRYTAEALAPDYPEVDIAKNVSFTQFQSWVTRSSDSLFAARIDSAIVRFKHTPAYVELLERYGIR